MGETNNQTPNREAKLQSGRSALSCNHIGWNGRRPLTNTTRTSSTSTPATLVVRCCSMRASQPAPPCSRGQAQVGHISRGQRTARPTQLRGRRGGGRTPAKQRRMKLHRRLVVTANVTLSSALDVAWQPWLEPRCWSSWKSHGGGYHAVTLWCRMNVT